MILLKRLMILMLIGVMLVVALSQSAEMSSEEELIEVASKDLVPEIREAASLALSQRLTEDCREIAEKAMTFLRLAQVQALLEELERIKGPEEEFLGKLEEIATGPTPEFRRAAIFPLISCSYPFFSLLVEAFQEELPIEGLTREELIASIPEGESFELRLARAIWAFFLRTDYPCSPSVEELVRLEMRILKGETVEVCGYRLDGSIPAIRTALLSGTKGFWYSYPGPGVFPLSLAGMVSAFSHTVSTYHLRNALGCQSLLDGSLGGETPEFRAAMASAYVGFCLEDPAIENLKELTITGESKELRKAAAAELVELLVGSDIDDSQLQRLALSGESPELRWAAGMALGLRWATKALGARLEIDDIPQRSSATAYSVEQALVIFAAENTFIHPGLARAAVHPLAVFFAHSRSQCIN